MAAIFSAGYFIGVVERDAQWLRRQVHVSQLSAEIVRWDRVEQLVKESPLHQPTPV